EVNVIDPALFVKGVLKEGALQDKEGFGIAVEAGPLLPSTEKGERRFGFEGIGIVSDTLGPFMFHLNGGLGIQRSTGDLVGIWGLIRELPGASGVRVVAEGNGVKRRRAHARTSVLAAALWQLWLSTTL